MLWNISYLTLLLLGLQRAHCREKKTDEPVHFDMKSSLDLLSRDSNPVVIQPSGNWSTTLTYRRVRIA